MCLAVRGLPDDLGAPLAEEDVTRALDEMGVDVDGGIECERKMEALRAHSGTRSTTTRLS